MTWNGTLVGGLIRVQRTFILTDYTGLTHLRVRDTASGALGGLVRKAMAATKPSLPECVEAVKLRAELLSFHLEKGLFPAPPVGTASTSRQQENGSTAKHADHASPHTTRSTQRVHRPAHGIFRRQPKS
jgi:hypothetical protein